MNMSANEFEFGILGLHFISLCFRCVSDFMVLFRRLILARVNSVSSFYSGDCFDSFFIPGFH